MSPIRPAYPSSPLYRVHRSLLVMVTLCLSALCARGQVELQVFPVLDQSWGTSDKDVLRKVSADEQGATIAGYSKGNPTAGNADGWILRVLPTGKIDWETRLPSPSGDLLTGISPAPDGSWNVIGTSDWHRTGLFNTYAIRGTAASLGADGKIAWNKMFELFYAPVRFNHLLARTNGEIVIGANAEAGTNTFRTDRGFGGNDYWLLTVDSAGEPLWNQTFGGSAYDYLLNVIEVSDGYLLGGISDSPADGNKTAAPLGGKDFWLVKTDKTGAKLWDRAYGSASSDELNALTTLPNGNVVLGGTTITNDNLDTLLIEVDRNGEIVRQATFGGAGNDVVTALETTSDGGILLGGFSNSAPGTNKTSPSHGGADFWVVKLSSTLDHEWEWSGGGSADDILLDVAEGSPGAYWLVGHSHSAQGGNKRSPAHGLDDGWIVQLATRSAPTGSPIVTVNGTVSLANRHTVTGSAIVYLTTSLPGGRLVYTLDGSAPHWSSPRYTEPLILSNSATIRAGAMTADSSVVVQSDPVAVDIIPEVRFTTDAIGHGELITSPLPPYPLNDFITVSASPAEGWGFGGWADDSTLTNRTRTIQLTADTNIVAYFVKFEALAGPGGRVVVAPTNASWAVGTEISLHAIPTNGFAFASWSDGNTSASRSITLQAGMNSLIARFINTTSVGEYYNAETLFGGPAPGGVNAVPTPDGGLLVHESSGGGIYQHPRSTVRKIDKKGVEQWVNTYRGFGSSKVLRRGGFVTWQYGTVRLLNSSGEQIAEARLVEGDASIRVEELENGDIVAVATGPSVGFPDLRTLIAYRFNADLNEKKSKIITGLIDRIPLEIKTDGKGGYLVLCRPPTGEVLEGVYVDESDAIRWQRQWNPSIGTFGKTHAAVSAVREAESWVIGTTATPSSDSGSAYPWIFRINDAGEKVDQAPLGGSQNETFKQFLRSPSGALFAWSGPTLVKLRQNLESEWEFTLPGPGAATLAHDGTIQHASPFSVRTDLPAYLRYFVTVTRIDHDGSLISSTHYEVERDPVVSVGALWPTHSGGLIALLNTGDWYRKYLIQRLTPTVQPEPPGVPRIAVKTGLTDFPMNYIAEVMISSSFGDGYIRYTLDGSFPTSASPLFGSTLTIRSNSVLRARAYSSDGSTWVDSDPVRITVPVPVTFTLTPRAGGTTKTSASAGYLLGLASVAYPTNTVLRAQATAAEGNVFLQWVGDHVSTNADTSFTLTGDTQFAPLFGTRVTTQVTGNGHLVFESPGDYQPYGDIRINALPAEGHYLSSWSHFADAARNPVPFTVTAPNQIVGAAFAPLPEGKVSLSVPVFGPGEVLVQPLKQHYDRGETVTVRAYSPPGAMFTGYSGDATNRNSELVVTLTESKIIAATFSGMTERGFSLNIPTGATNTAFSTDLLDWVPTTTSTNTLGIRQLNDYSSATNSRGFFRW